MIASSQRPRDVALRALRARSETITQETFGDQQWLETMTEARKSENPAS